MTKRPRIALLYHYFWPDDVVSAVHFAGLATGLAARGWDVEAFPSVRGCRNGDRYPRRETYRGVRVRRIWRPPLEQSKAVGRLANAAWMTAAWSALALRRSRRQPDVVVIGTDPVLSVLAAAPLRRLRPTTRIVHWCFDLYPESAIAEGMLSRTSPLARSLTRLVRHAYASCDLLADLGPFMAQRLAAYRSGAAQETLVPWALDEPEQPAPPDPAMRRRLFGDARLGLLYSGSFGRAHGFAEFLELAAALEHDGVHFSFAVRGNRADELRRAAGVDRRNVSFAPFVPQEQLSAQLSAADIHLASLRREWAGLVVPSKFFGSLAAGRPVVYAGPEGSDLAHWIGKLGVGWTVGADVAHVAAELRALAASPERLAELQAHAHAVYHERFSYRRVLDSWDARLRGLLAGPRTAAADERVTLVSGRPGTVAEQAR